MSRYLLVSVEDGEDIPVTIPSGIVKSDILEDLKDKVTDEKELKGLLIKLARVMVNESDNGGITVKDKHFSDLNLRDAIKDTVNHRFHEKHEEFYSILRDLGITF